MKFFAHLIVHFVFMLSLFLSTETIFAQEKDTDKSSTQTEAIRKNGGWLISKTPPVSPRTTEEEYEEIGQNITTLLSQNIVPQALDRNIVGELLITYQLSPPATKAYQWTLKKYASEKQMMKDMEEQSLDAWAPTGMDVQQDAAFVLYVRNGEHVSAARLIKITSVQELSNSIKTYYEIGYLPATISVFKTQLWILFTQTIDKDISDSDVLVRSDHKDATGTILTEELSKKDTSLIDTAYTADNKVIMIFSTPKTNKRP